MADPHRVEVAVVGFGPVGATVAGLLGRRGIDTVVIDREWDVFPLPRAAHIDHAALRTLQEVGVVDELLPDMLVNQGLDFLTARGELLIQIPADDGSISGFPASSYFYQPDFDRQARRAVENLPSVEVRLGTEVTDQTDDHDGVVLTCRTPDGEVQQIHAAWVIGCDGASSGTRQRAGIELEDLDFEESWIVVDLLLAAPDPLMSHKAFCYCDPARPTYSIPMPGGRHRFEFRLMDGDDDTTDSAEQIRQLVSPYLTSEIIDIERKAIYTFRGLVARQWRRGRILLAGDAAHQMPPFLGQGMCSGIRDAANLAWKLDLVLRGRAPQELMDTYASERATHVRRIVESVVDLGRIICTVDADEAAKRDRRLLSDPTPAARRMPFAIPSLDDGDLVLEGGGGLFVQPVLDVGVRFDDVIGPRFAVIGRQPSDLAAVQGWWSRSVGAFVAPLADLGHFAAPLGEWLDARSVEAVIVRPDRYVLWAGHDVVSATERVAHHLSGAPYSALVSELTDRVGEDH